MTTKTRFVRSSKSISSLLSSTKYACYKGVIENYIQRVGLWVESEHKGGVDRAKAYREFAIKCISSGTFVVPTNKYRHLRPILRLIRVMLRNNDQALLTVVTTALRCYDLYEPTSKEQKAQFQKFLLEFTSDSRISPHSQIKAVSSTFPLAEFSEYLSSLACLKDKQTKQPFSLFKKRFPLSEPQEFAIMLSKKGTVYVPKSEAHSSVHGWLPSITGAQYEISLYADKHPNEYKMIIALGNFLGKPFGMSHKPVKGVRPVENYLTEYNIPLRRLSYFGQHGNKTRVVAILNYPLQQVLKPIHDTLMKALKTIPFDFTKSHDEGFKAMKNLTNTCDYIKCFDLSSATDAFPVIVQVLAISEIFGDQIGKLWYNLLTQYGFQEPLTGQTRYYSIGQPMGAFSSWTAFAVTHHFLVTFAASRVFGKRIHPWSAPRYFSYGLVGDDLYIADPKVAAEYAALMSALHVKINDTKSLTYQKGITHVSEFVKRNAYEDLEISAISPNLLLKATSDSVQLSTLIKLLSERFGDSIDLEPWIESFIHKFYGNWTEEWIATMQGLPVSLGGYWRLSKDGEPVKPLVEPELLQMLILYKIDYSAKFIYYGETTDRNGRLLTDELNASFREYYSDIISDSDNPINLYQRNYTTGIEETSRTIRSQMLNLYDEFWSDETMSDPEILPYFIEDFLAKIDELLDESLDVPFYFASAVSKKQINRLFHRIKRSKKKLQRSGQSAIQKMRIQVSEHWTKKTIRDQDLSSKKENDSFSEELLALFQSSLEESISASKRVRHRSNRESSEILQENTVASPGLDDEFGKTITHEVEQQIQRNEFIFSEPQPKPDFTNFFTNSGDPDN